MSITPSVYVGLFLLSGSVLILEITLTRIFSVLLWGHHGFLVISTALLGFGAAGSYLAIRPKERDEARSRRFLARNCALYALTLIVSVMVCTRLGYQPKHTFTEIYHTLMLPLMYSVLAIPFFFAGLAIGFLLSTFARDINRIYFADLIGAGVGALAVTFLLGNVGAPAALLIAGTLALVAGALFLGPLRRIRTFVGVGAYIAALVATAVTDPWHVPVPKEKGLHKHRAEVADSRWSLLARIDILEDAKRPLDFGSGAAKPFLERPVSFRPFYMDGSNPSRMIRYDQDLWFVPKLLSATPYALDLGEPRVLIIGSGGGIDVLVALHFGAEHVTAVEINPATVALVERDYADYVGHIFARPNVEHVAAEGRHFLTLNRGTFDLVRMTGVDTRAASAIGANAQDHAYLYTLEAFDDLLDHLTDEGILAVTRGRGWHHRRLLNTIASALEARGIREPGRHVVVVSNGRWTETLVRLIPFEKPDLQALASWARESAMRITYDPLRDGTALGLAQLIAEQRAEGGKDSSVNLTPVTDDSPFFFEPARVRDVIDGLFKGEGLGLSRSAYPTLLLSLAGACVFSALLILLPLLLRRGGPRPAQSRGWSLSYFSLLGLGFILAELIFIQKYMIFLGGPVYSLSVTLFSILVFSGLGAWAARRLEVRSRTARFGVLASVVVLLLLTNGFLRWGLPHLLGLPFALRVLVGIGSLAPVSFLMGMPFPLGIAILERTARGLIPWAWGTNACLTVIGSVLSVIVSMSWGFFAAMMFAVVCYALAAVCVSRMRTDAPSATSELARVTAR